MPELKAVCPMVFLVYLFSLKLNSCNSGSLKPQGWRQKFSDRGARASDRGAKMTEKLCFCALF